MLQILDSLIATAAVILGLSLVVQSLQQIFKQWLELKAEYMLNELISLFSTLQSGTATLPSFYSSRSVREDVQKKNADPFVSRLIDELQVMVSGLGFRDLHLLENIDTNTFVEMLKSLPLAQEKSEELQAKFQEAVENATRWFDFTKQSFQEHYERRMKYWSFCISTAVVIALNANLLDVYQEFSHNQTLRDAAVTMADALTQQGKGPQIIRSSDGKSDSLAAAAVPDSVTVQKIRMNAVVIQQMLDEQSFQVMGWTDARLERYETMPWYTRAIRFIVGWFGMTLLVSLGAPFWYDLLKMVMGIKDSFKKNVEQ